MVEQYDASDGVQIIIKYWIPYNKFLMSREKEKGSKYAHFSIVCKQYYENSKTLLTKKTITDRYIEIETQDQKDEYFYDSDRIMYTHRKKTMI